MQVFFRNEGKSKSGTDWWAVAQHTFSNLPVIMGREDNVRVDVVHDPLRKPSVQGQHRNMAYHHH